jgi:hypothetical protein
MSLDEFRELLDRHARPDLATAIDGVRICKTDYGAAPESGMSGTVLAVIARGGKRLALGDRFYDYGAGQYLIASVDLPVTGHVINTAPGHPALGFGMTLEPGAIAELLLQARQGDLPRSPGTARPGIAVSDAPEELVDAIVRLLRLLDRPRDRRALVPLVKREILWRLMTGEQGDVVRQLAWTYHAGGAVDPGELRPAVPRRGSGAAVGDECLGVPPEFPGGHVDEPDPVPEAHPAAGGEIAAGEQPWRRHRRRQSRRIRQSVAVQPGVPAPVRCSAEP